MTLLLEVPTRAASLTSSQLATLLRVWSVAGLPPVSGYGTTFLAVAAASDPTIAGTLSSVDLDDAGSVAAAVEVVLQWRRRIVQATS